MAAALPTTLLLVLVVNLGLAVEDGRGDVPRKILENGDEVTTPASLPTTRPRPFR